MSFEDSPDCLVTLVIPLGRLPSIFPWGVHLISDYLTTQRPSTKVQILDLSIDRDIETLLDEYQDDLLRLKGSLLPKAQRVFSVSTSPDQAYFAVAAALGSRFLELAGANQMFSLSSRISHFPGKARKRLDDLAGNYEEIIATRIKAHCPPAYHGPHLWGIATFDHTAFAALHFAERIRRHSKPSAIVLGGDYWDFHSAWKLISSGTKLVDGVVVGYGEQALQEIVEAMTTKNQGVADQWSIVGLVNQWTIDHEKPREKLFVTKPELATERKPDPFTTQSFNLPIAYLGKSDFPFKIVHDGLDSEGGTIIHLITQRGCSWGACQFCTQIDKNLFFNFSTEQLRQQLVPFLENLPTGKSIIISIDNDEICESTLVFLIELLTGYYDKIKSVFAWLQVKTVNKTILDALHRSGHASKFHFALNWESVNPKTLKLMGKGHTPLQAFAASKAILDVGASFETNYMIWYPGEESKSKIEELRLLRAASHLVFGRFLGFLYSATRRDNIFRRAESLGIDVRRNPFDVWIREVFGADLESTIWMYTWRTRLSRKFSSVVKWIYEIVMDSDRIRFPLDYLTGGLMVISGNSVFLKIDRLYSWLIEGKVDTDQPERFSVSGKTLIRHSSIPLEPKELNTELKETELALLRHAYWPITEEQLIHDLAEQVDPTGVKQALNQLESLGSIVRQGNQLVSVVNDPDYWVSFSKD